MQHAREHYPAPFPARDAPRARKIIASYSRASSGPGLPHRVCRKTSSLISRIRAPLVLSFRSPWKESLWCHCFVSNIDLYGMASTLYPLFHECDFDVLSRFSIPVLSSKGFMTSIAYLRVFKTFQVSPTEGHVPFHLRIQPDQVIVSAYLGAEGITKVRSTFFLRTSRSWFVPC